MSHGYKFDAWATRQAIESGQFKCKDSRMDKNCGEHLAGIDKANRRHEIYVRDKGRCVDCQKWLPENGTIWERAHWAHKETEFGRRDNLEDGHIKCYKCHIVKEHNREPLLRSIPNVPDNSKTEEPNGESEESSEGTEAQASETARDGRSQNPRTSLRSGAIRGRTGRTDGANEA